MEHVQQEDHLTGSDIITDIVIGMSDGLTIPFILAAGLSGAAAGTGIIITAGLIAIGAGSVAMGLGGYLAGKAEQDDYNAGLMPEPEEMESVPEREKQVRDAFAGMGLSQDIQQQIAEETAKDKEQWADFMMKYDLGLGKQAPKRARNSGFIIGISYIVSGLVSLIPYIFASQPLDGLKWSCCLTVICLFIFGFLKAKVMGQNPWGGAVRVMLTGAAAAALAFFVAHLFIR